jgi:hypothetical protein
MTKDLCSQPGPFIMNPGDTQTIVIAQIIAKGSSNIQSVATLRTYDALAQRIYDNCFQVPRLLQFLKKLFCTGKWKDIFVVDDVAENNYSK